MVLYNQALFREANILDLFYCSCSKLDAERKTLAKTLKKGYFECPTWHTCKDPKLRGWVDALLFFERWTVFKLSQAECQMWLVILSLYFVNSYHALWTLEHLDKIWTFHIFNYIWIYKTFCKSTRGALFSNTWLIKAEYNFRHCKKWRVHTEEVKAKLLWDNQVDGSYRKDPVVIIFLIV